MGLSRFLQHAPHRETICKTASGLMARGPAHYFSKINYTFNIKSNQQYERTAKTRATTVGKPLPPTETYRRPLGTITGALIAHCYIF